MPELSLAIPIFRTSKKSSTPPPGLPVPDFSGDVRNGILPFNTQFTDLSTENPTIWDWNFGDGTPHGTTQNPLHTYATAGIYTVTLIATNAIGSDTEIKVAYIVAGYLVDSNNNPILDGNGNPIPLGA